NPSPVFLFAVLESNSALAAVVVELKPSWPFPSDVLFFTVLPAPAILKPAPVLLRAMLPSRRLPPTVMLKPPCPLPCAVLPVILFPLPSILNPSAVLPVVVLAPSVLFAPVTAKPACPLSWEVALWIEFREPLTSMPFLVFCWRLAPLTVLPSLSNWIPNWLREARTPVRRCAPLPPTRQPTVPPVVPGPTIVSWPVLVISTTGLAESAAVI